MSTTPNKRITSSDSSRCPNCDYNDGFHTAFKPAEDNRTEVIFICPACHSRFDTGWIIDLASF